MCSFVILSRPRAFLLLNFETIFEIFSTVIGQSGISPSLCFIAMFNFIAGQVRQCIIFISCVYMFLMFCTCLCHNFGVVMDAYIVTVSLGICAWSFFTSFQKKNVRQVSCRVEIMICLFHMTLILHVHSNSKLPFHSILFIIHPSDSVF